MVRPHPMSSHDFLSDKYVTNDHFSNFYFETTFFSKIKPRLCVECNSATFLGFIFSDFGGGREKLDLDQLIPFSG